MPTEAKHRFQWKIYKEAKLGGGPLEEEDSEIMGLKSMGIEKAPMQDLRVQFRLSKDTEDLKTF